MEAVNMTLGALYKVSECMKVAGELSMTDPMSSNRTVKGSVGVD